MVSKCKCLGGALTTFPCKFGPAKIVLRPGGARAPSAPPGYAYVGGCLKGD